MTDREIDNMVSNMFSEIRDEFEVNIKEMLKIPSKKPSLWRKIKFWFKLKLI